MITSLWPRQQSKTSVEQGTSSVLIPINEPPVSGAIYALDKLMVQLICAIRAAEDSLRVVVVVAAGAASVAIERRKEEEEEVEKRETSVKYN